MQTTVDNLKGLSEKATHLASGGADGLVVTISPKGPKGEPPQGPLSHLKQEMSSPEIEKGPDLGQDSSKLLV
jgi:hypothetical protein